MQRYDQTLSHLVCIILLSLSCIRSTVRADSASQWYPDDSRRVVPVTVGLSNGKQLQDNVAAQICNTPPPDISFKARLGTIANARQLEKRGFDRKASGLHYMGLDNDYDAIGRDHPDWDTGLNISDVATGKTHRRLRKRQSSSPIVVETYMHLVTTKDQSKYYTQKTRDAIMNNQVIALNQAYRPVGVVFHQNKYTYTIRDDWATDASSTKMKQALRQGGYSALNIYFQTNLSSSGPGGSTLLGYCTFPTNITYAYNGQTYTYPQSQWATDGCDVLAATLPGSPVSVYGYNEGKTAVHEVGHWFGLLHTFQDNTCNPNDPGDYIDDTPQESQSTVGCPVGKNSCPDRPGDDPITNYMDYSTDQCYNQFTADQISRMKDLFSSLRKGY